MWHPGLFDQSILCLFMPLREKVIVLHAGDLAVACQVDQGNSTGNQTLGESNPAYQFTFLFLLSIHKMLC